MKLKKYLFLLFTSTFVSLNSFALEKTMLDTSIYFTSKADIQFIDQDEVQDFKGHIRYKKGDSLWISFTGFMGIEGARIMVKKDSTYVINKLENSYLSFTNYEQNDLIPFGLTLEEWDLILLNTSISNIPDSNILIETNLDTKILTKYDSDKISKYYIDSNNNLTKMTIDKRSLNTTCEIVFNLFKKEPTLKKDISYQKTISIKSDYNDIKIKINYSAINFNKTISMPFSYSKKL